MIVVTDIQWDADDKDLNKILPQKFEIADEDIPDYIDTNDKDGLDEFVSDYITDKSGFCHSGFNYKIR